MCVQIGKITNNVQPTMQCPRDSQGARALTDFGLDSHHQLVIERALRHKNLLHVMS
jgi:hypothetical protein